MDTVSSKVKFVKSVFGDCDLDRSGENVAVSCPSCKNSTKRKLSINLSTWQTHCWVCGLKGKTLFPILKKYFSYDQALNFKERFMPKGIKLANDTHDHEEDEKLVLPQALAFDQFFEG